MTHINVYQGTLGQRGGPKWEVLGHQKVLSVAMPADSRRENMKLCLQLHLELRVQNCEKAQLGQKNFRQLSGVKHIFGDVSQFFGHMFAASFFLGAKKNT